MEENVKSNLALDDIEVVAIAKMLEEFEHCSIRFVIDQDIHRNFYEWSAEPDTGSTYVCVTTSGTCAHLGKLILTSPSNACYQAILHAVHQLVTRHCGYLMVDNVIQDERAQLCRIEGLTQVASSNDFVEVTQK